MAVQAQYPANALFLSRGEGESKGADFATAPTTLFDQSPFSNGGDGASRKRARESAAPSTGLRLAVDDRRGRQDDLAALVDRQRDEIERLVAAQGEQLRKALAEKRQHHLRTLLGVAEESAARQLRDKEAELGAAARRRAELEDRLARLRAESMTWQMKAMADQAAAASLHAQLQQATAATTAAVDVNHGSGSGSNWAEDGESAYVDPDRVEPARACRTCRSRVATVVLLPCRHLCVCDACDTVEPAGPVRVCPVCCAVRTGSVQVFLW